MGDVFDKSRLQDCFTPDPKQKQVIMEVKLAKEVSHSNRTLEREEAIQSQAESEKEASVMVHCTG